eukprot:6209038-Pleurochrysis_carterae.AAC.8
MVAPAEYKRKLMQLYGICDLLLYSTCSIEFATFVLTCAVEANYQLSSVFASVTAIAVSLSCCGARALVC